VINYNKKNSEKNLRIRGKKGAIMKKVINHFLDPFSLKRFCFGRIKEIHRSMRGAEKKLWLYK
jgi:hypothetical protein